jgi:hypothetical protein
MKKRKIISLIIPVLAILALSACKEEAKFPVEPYIEFVSFTKIQNAAGIDEKGVLKLYFTDGDGDIGLSHKDTESPFDTSSMYYYNFFISYFEKQKGIFKEIILPMTNNSRIPVINPSGKNRSVEGEIEMEIFINNPFSTYDTIRFECFIVDRALNHSNSVTTPDIIIRKF